MATGNKVKITRTSTINTFRRGMACETQYEDLTVGRKARSSGCVQRENSTHKKEILRLKYNFRWRFSYSDFFKKGVPSRNEVLGP